MLSFAVRCGRSMRGNLASRPKSGRGDRRGANFWLFVDLTAGEPSDGAPTTLFSRRSAGCPLQVKPRVSTVVRCGRGPCEIFCGDPSCSSSSSAGGDACRKRTVPSLHEPLMRDLAKSQRARGPARSRRARARDGSRDRASGEAGMVGCGALRNTMEFPEKMRIAPCRASIRLPFPTSPGKLRAPRQGRRGETLCCAWGTRHRSPVMRGVQPDLR